MCLYSINILLGTIGNALVARYFEFGERSIHLGSRFVVVLALVDFVSSIVIPGFHTVRILCNSITYEKWPL